MSSENLAPLISVVIPTYNRAHLINAAVNSILFQTYKNWELIIVDDGSTDSTKELGASYEEKDARVYYYHIENSGAAFARNYGAEKASGEYLTFLDSDDEAKPHWLAIMVSLLFQHDAVLVSCAVKKILFSGQEVLMKPRAYPYSRGLIVKITNGGSFMLKHDLFWAIKGYDSKVRSGQHTELGVRLIPFIIQHGLSVVATDEVLVNVIDRGGVSIRKDDEAVYFGSQYFLNKHRKYLEEYAPQMVFDYLSVGGVRALRIGKIQEGKKLLFQAWKKKPFNLKAIGRLFYAYLDKLAI